jgi:hypothetical protein
MLRNPVSNMKKVLTNWKLIALALAAVGLATIGRGSARPLPDTENNVCTNAILDGSYQWSVAGLVQTDTNVNANISEFAPLAEASFATFDGHGNVTNLVSTDNFSGGGSFTATGTGTYTVTSDCQGNVTFNSPQVGTVSRHLVIRDRDTVDFVQSDAGLIFAGTMKKRSQ